MNFYLIFKILVSKINSKSQDKGDLIKGPFRILRGEWASGLYSLRQVTEVKLGRVGSDSGWVTTEA